MSGDYIQAKDRSGPREVLRTPRRELREHRRLLVGLIEHVPKLEAATTQECAESTQPVEEEPKKGDVGEAVAEVQGPSEGAFRAGSWRVTVLLAIGFVVGLVGC